MISKTDVENLAELARLKLDEKEIELLGKDISNILGYVGQVSTFSGAYKEEKPKLRNVVREDSSRAKDDTLAEKEEALRSAFPKREKDFNVVRKIIEKDE